MKEFVTRYREVIAYLVVGVLTTVVSWGAKALFDLIFFAGTTHPTNLQNFILSVVNWVAGVAFAYPANRRWVFESREKNILREAAGFVASRVATLLLDILMMQLIGNVLGLDLVVATAVSSVLVVIANYLLAKLLVFRKSLGD